ncbi:hypothetical protein FN846DRAFT_913430 [Sphaerosporella brunnea]|uniref:Uncharacterized protein n=1 Tax=Sphaerosporella brunnea TaxID=1250544 RepID=A0A5J5EFS7_9PEZI|nr:hypothetical protein FN846DRAFT_913430 [Sphaerosporella brunnea]
MTLTNERYLRVGFSGSTYLSTAAVNASAAGHPTPPQVPFHTSTPVTAYAVSPKTTPDQPTLMPQIGYGPGPVDLNAIDGKRFCCEKYGHKAPECAQPDLREGSHNWCSSCGGGYANHCGCGNSARGGYINTRTDGNRGFTCGGNCGGCFSGNYQVYTIEAGEGDDENNVEWPIEELAENPGMDKEDLEGATGRYAETGVSKATTTVPRLGNVTQ